jgi:hypothetical protein
LIGRWVRVSRAIPAQPRRVLDPRCAFGFGTSRLPFSLQLDEPERSANEHRHFTLDELFHCAGNDFEIRRVSFSGIGWPEIVHLALLVACLGFVRSARFYRWLRYVYFTLYLLDDLLPIGARGYHLQIIAGRAVQTSRPDYFSEVRMSG